mmetsp:Transcript_54326/g.165055  ORF Transcript_54326/g.165055 Transcript_54326/m.165055 type:complete len:82 (+) Transcript_54326:285-530(+)
MRGFALERNALATADFTARGSGCCVGSLGVDCEAKRHLAFLGVWLDCERHWLSGRAAAWRDFWAARPALLCRAVSPATLRR